MRRPLEIESGVGNRRKVIKVNFYSGYKGEERPLSFEVGGKIHSIIEITERKIVEDLRTRERKRIYLVKTDEGKLYELEENEGWNLKRLDTKTDSHFA